MIPQELPPSQEFGQKVTVRQAFITGLVALFPVVLTIFVLTLCWGVVQKLSTPLGNLITWLLSQTMGIEEGRSPVWLEGVGTMAALALGVLFVYLLGWSLAGVMGRRFIKWADTLFSRLPVVSYIYPHAKQLSDFLFGGRKLRFNRVVAIEYPRKGLYTIGFVTSDGITGLSRRSGRKLVAVFVPTSPTPFTGWTVLVDENEVLPVNMTVDESVRFAVTCGVITPGKEFPDGVSVPPLTAPEGSTNMGDGP